MVTSLNSQVMPQFTNFSKQIISFGRVKLLLGGIYHKRGAKHVYSNQRKTKIKVMCDIQELKVIGKLFKINDIFTKKDIFTRNTLFPW